MNRLAPKTHEFRKGGNKPFVLKPTTAGHLGDFDKFNWNIPREVRIGEEGVPLNDTRIVLVKATVPLIDCIVHMSQRQSITKDIEVIGGPVVTVMGDGGGPANQDKGMAEVAGHLIKSSVVSGNKGLLIGRKGHGGEVGGCVRLDARFGISI